MHKTKIAKWDRSIYSIAIANFDAWIHTPRTYLMVLFISAICYLQICGYKMTLQTSGYTMHLIETLFYELNFGCNMSMTTTLFLITISEIPRQISFQQYLLIRTNRIHWILAQMLYCLFMVLTMILLIIMCLTIAALPISTPGQGWSDLERLSSQSMQIEDALIPKYILFNYTPTEALFLSLIPIFMFWLVMVFVVLFFGIWGAPVWGVMIYASLMVANVTILFELFPFQLVLPMHFATLENITAGHIGNEITILRNVGFAYLILIALLACLMILSVKWRELVFYSDRKL